jgi:hypothetical protein
MAIKLARAGFDIDLRDGEAKEDAFKTILNGTTVEVKSDKKCRTTGNLFVEYRQQGRPSGIAVTTADYWAFEYDDDCWLLLPTKKLKAIARMVSIHHRNNRVKGGDYNEYDGVLIPINWLTGTIRIAENVA